MVCPEEENLTNQDVEGFTGAFYFYHRSFTNCFPKLLWRITLLSLILFKQCSHTYQLRTNKSILYFLIVNYKELIFCNNIVSGSDAVVTNARQVPEYVWSDHQQKYPFFKRLPFDNVLMVGWVCTIMHLVEYKDTFVLINS